MEIIIDEKLNPKRWYSLIEVTQFTPVKSREMLTLHIRNGFLKARSKGEGPGKRYLILGADIADYIERYSQKLCKYSRFKDFKAVPANRTYEKFKNPPRRK